MYSEDRRGYPCISTRMTDDDPSEQLILDKVRAMWEFAATTQFLYLFFDMFGLQEFDVEVPLPPALGCHRQIWNSELTTCVLDFRTRVDRYQRSKVDSVNTTTIVTRIIWKSGNKVHLAWNLE